MNQRALEKCIWDCKQLTAPQVKVAYEISRFGLVCVASLSTLSERTGMDAKTISRHINYLSEEGYLWVRQQKRENGSKSTKKVILFRDRRIWTEKDREKRLKLAKICWDRLEEQEPKDDEESNKKGATNKTTPASIFYSDAHFLKSRTGYNSALRPNNTTSEDSVQVANCGENEDKPCYSVTLEDIQGQIETEAILQDCQGDIQTADMVQTISEVITDTINAGRDVFVNKQKISFKRIYEEFKRLTMFEVLWVIERMKKYHPRNVRAYLRSVLFNARLDSEAEAQRRIQEDLERGYFLDDYIPDAGPGASPAFG